MVFRFLPPSLGLVAVLLALTSSAGNTQTNPKSTLPPVWVSALNLADKHLRPVDPAHWIEQLRITDPTEENGPKRLGFALRLADSSMQMGTPPQVEAALKLANEIAAGKETPAQQPIPSFQKTVQEFRRLLACRAVSLGKMDIYGAPLVETEVYAQVLLGQLGAQAVIHKANPLEALSSMESLLLRARGYAGSNVTLTAQIDADLKEIQAYRAAVNAFSPQLASAWAAAAKKTNSAMKPADWDAAATSWKGLLLTQLVGRPASERREAALHVVNAHLRKADALRAEGNKEAARTALRTARNELNATPETVGAHLTDEDKQKVLGRVSANGKALSAGTGLAGGLAENNIPPYRGAKLAKPTTPCAIVRYPSPITPNVDRWLADLRNNTNATRRLVNWFNEGPLAQRTPAVKRDFSTDPRSPNYLVTFLAANVSRRTGVLVPGTVQWCDHNGKGPWHGTPVKKPGGAAYYLKNGRPLINAACSNPIGVIAVAMSTGSWTEQTESATPPPAAPPIPPLLYAQPRAVSLKYNDPIVEVSQ